MKKYLSAFLTILFLLSILPTNIFTVKAVTEYRDGYYYLTVSDGEVTITDCDTSIIGDVEIPSEFAGKSVVAIENFAFAGCANITKVTIPDGVQRIGNNAFSGCEMLNEIIISDSVKSIGSSAFYSCCNLKHIRIPEAVTAIYGYTFKNCTNLKSVTVYDNIAYIGEGEFENCAALETIYYIGSQSSWESIDNRSFINANIIFSLEAGEFQTGAKWALDRDGTLYIYGEGETDNYTKETEVPWYDYKDQITAIKIENTITSIGSFSFYSLANVKRVDTVNPDMTFGKRTFKTGTQAVIYGGAGSNVEEYAKSNLITFVKAANPAVPNAPFLDCCSNNAVVLKFVVGYEYSIDGINWQSDSVFGDLSSNTEYKFYQRIADGIYMPSISSEALTVTTLSALGTPTVERMEGCKVILTAAEGYQYSRDGVVWQDNNVFSPIPFNEIQYFYRRIVAKTTDWVSSASTPVKVLIISAPKVLVGFDTLRVKPTEGYEYSLDGKYWQDSNYFEVLDGEYYTVYHRLKDGGDVNVYVSGGTDVYTDGKNAIAAPTADDLIWLKKILLTDPDSNSLAADANEDGEINILDFIRMKKLIAG